MRKILRVDITNEGLYPEVLQLLKRLPAQNLFHTKYPFRHPAAIYLLSLIQLAGDFNRLLTAYTAIRDGQGGREFLLEEIAQCQRILIYSVREHLDDCQMILLCLVDPTAVTGRDRSPEEILKASGFAEQKIFWAEVHNYVGSYLSPLVNNLKHSQGRLRTVVFECPERDLRPGFYLEEIDAAETAQPSSNLHNGNTAISFAKDIRSNLALIFRASQSLQAAIEAFVKRARITLLPDTGERPKAGTWKQICAAVANLDAGVFPQEVKSRFFRVDLVEGSKLRIREVDRDQKLSFPAGTAKVTVAETVDGMTKGYRMPYTRTR